MMKTLNLNPKARLMLLILLVASVTLNAQNYTSTADGAWTTGSNWGGSAPATSGQSWGTINVNHNMTISGNYSTSAGTLNIATNKSLTINGNFSISNGITVNVYGTLTMTGNASINATFRVHPGGKVYIQGNATVFNSTYIIVGTAVAPPAYADFVVYQNLRSQSSGDVTVNQNGRVAVFGNMTSDASGGTVFTVNNGGQVYIDKNINYTGGGDQIVNNNSTNPYGLYVNGTTSVNTSQGATATSNSANKATMKNTNLPFYNWVASLPNSPLPVTLIFFSGVSSNDVVVLEWATASENGFDHFVIERSFDGKEFHQIGTVQGHGTTAEKHSYSFTDYQPVIGTLYYRLRANDIDGSFEYSEVVPVVFSTAKQVTAYPNPSVGEFININTNFTVGESARVYIFDSTGLHIGDFPVSDFASKLDFTSTLNPGAYLLKFVSPEHSEVIRFTVK